MARVDDLDGLMAELPEAETITAGLEDLRRGVKDTVGALLVAIAAPRLRSLGLDVPPDDRLPDEPELRLYRHLCRISTDGGAYVQYKAMLSRLVSFEEALERRVWAKIRAEG